MVTDQDYHDEPNRAIEELIAERDKLKDALEEIKNLGIGDQMIYAHKIVNKHSPHGGR